MLIHRRDFLRLLGFAATVGMAFPASVSKTFGDLYRNKRLSLSLKKPSGWHFLSVVDYQDAVQHHVLAVESPEVEEILRSPESLPFLVVTKFPAEYDDLNPVITAWDEPIDSAAGSVVDCHLDALRAYKNIVREAQILAEPKRVSIPGADSASRSSWQFVFEHDSGREWLVLLTTLLVYREERMHTFHFMQGNSPPAIATEDLAHAERSIAYDTGA
jgi:hypothetical protein